MRRKGFLAVVVAEALFCIWYFLMQNFFTDIFSVIIAFPFEQIGYGLRSLSLSGSVQNAAACVIYVLLSLIPFAFYIWRVRKKRNHRSDLLLPLLSVILFIVVYYMINPGLFIAEYPQGGKLLLGGTFYSVLCGYLVLIALRKCRAAGKDGLIKALNVLLGVLVIVLVYQIFGSCIGAVPGQIQTVQEGNAVTDPLLHTFSADASLTMTYVFLVLQCIVNMIPYVMDILVIKKAKDMLDAVISDRYSEQSVQACRMLADTSVRAITITIISSIAFHILQLVFHAGLRQMNVSIVFPVLSVIFTACMYLIARYMRENQQMKQENDLFI